MSRAKALGRGLGNLIPGNKNSETSNDAESSSNFKQIKIDSILLNPTQPRKTFSENSIQELASTIKVHGLIQPLVVLKKDSNYELVSGERRLRACKIAGLKKVPVVIKNYSEEERLEIAIIENIQREDLNPIEEALAYQTLIEKLSLKITEVAERVGKNRTTVSNLLRLLQLPDSIKEFVKQGKISEGHVRPLLSIGDKKKMLEVANEIIAKSMSVRQVEDYVSKLTDTEKIVNIGKKQDPSIAKIENKIRTKFSSRVSISHNEKSGRGKIVFNYANLDDMERIINQFGL
ncbi:MAG: ParB/RepB/Spo0J family partition protein [Spirochaetota bacterium]